MRLLRFTWRVLLGSACFGSMVWSPTANADPGICPYVAGQNRACPERHDHCAEYVYDYDTVDVLDSLLGNDTKDDEVVSDCPFRSVHDAIYDAEVYGVAGPIQESADECIEKITVIHTKGQQSVEFIASDPEPFASNTDAEPANEQEDYSYDSEVDQNDYEDYEYDAYEYDYAYEVDLVEEPQSDVEDETEAERIEVVADESQWDEYGAYDEYDYDEYYYENNEDSTAEVAESEEILMPPAINDEAIEDSPMPYDEYGYDEYSIDESDPVVDDEYADYWNDVEVAGEESDADYWGEEDVQAELKEDVGSEYDDYWYEDELEGEYDNYWADEPAADQPRNTETAKGLDDLKPVAHVLSAMGIIPLAEGILGDGSLDQLAVKLAKVSQTRSPVGETAPCDDECGWEDWDCYYEFQQEKVAEPTTEIELGNSFRHIERQVLRILATSIDHAGRTLQTVSDDLMRMSDGEIARTNSPRQLK